MKQIYNLISSKNITSFKFNLRQQIAKESVFNKFYFSKNIFMITLFFTFSTQAHPVIYKDGVVVSSSNMTNYSDNQLMYSWNRKWSSGLNHWRFTFLDGLYEYGFLKTNHLLYRYNGESSQANIYLHAGIGGVYTIGSDQSVDTALMTGAEVDWETRSLFTALKYYYFKGEDLDDISMIQARVGVAPFEAGFDELQPWFMLQVMAMPEANVQDEIIVTPMLRFFYKNVLWEMGSSLRGEWMLNLMVHY